MRHVAWATSLALIACAAAYCTVEESRMRKDARQAEAEFCVKNGVEQLHQRGERIVK